MYKLLKNLLLGLAVLGLVFLMAAFLPGIRNHPRYLQHGIDPQAASAITLDDGTTIRVLVLYTPAARDALGGVQQIQTQIEEAISLMNLSFANSAINAQVVLAGVEEAAYTQSEDDLGTMLGYLTNPADGIMDNVHLLRNQNYADLVNLVVGPGTSKCYDGHYLGGEGHDFETLAFSIVRAGCMVSDLGFLQALGRNMGAREDWFFDDTDTPLTYSHGYINVQAGWRTVMTRDNLCWEYGTSCDHLPFWSNPSIYNNGQPMGVPANTNASCTAGVINNPPCDADNASVLNLNANTVANFRQGEPPPPAEILLVNDEAGSLPVVEAYYTQALQALSKTYDTHNTGANGADEPSLLELTPHSVVIWFTGLSRTADTGPSTPGETALAAWLEQGGCLLVSSQDYAQSSQPGVFIQQYLGIQSITVDSGYTSVTGSGPFSGLGPYLLTAPDGYPPSGLAYGDVLVPAPGAWTAFSSSQGSAAVYNLSRSYRTAYLGFSLETLPTPADQAAVLQRFLNTCQFQRVFLPMLSR